MLDLILVKNHLNIEPDFNDDDKLILQYIDAAEKAVMIHNDFANTSQAFDENGDYLPQIKAQMLLLIGNWYNFRESDVTSNVSGLKHGFDFLASLTHDYSYKTN